MKSFFICTFFVALASLCVVKAAMDEEMEAISKACQKEFPLTPEDRKAFSLDPVNNVNDAIKCHLKCMMEMQEVLEKGEFNVNNFLKSIENYPAFKKRHAAVLKATDDCKSEQGANDCETAYKLYLCLQNHEADVFANE